MMLSFFSNLGKSIAWSALDSIWQWGILWLTYSLLSRSKGFEKTGLRYNLALLHYFTGVVLFILYLFAHREGVPSISFRNISFGGLVQIGTSARFLPLINVSLGVIYLLAGALRFFRILIGLDHIRKLRSNAEPIHENWISARSNELQRQLGYFSPIGLWISNKITGPLTTGFLKPAIFFPFCALTNLSKQELETLLLHELIHVKRHDYLLNIAVQMAQCLLFFNPFSQEFVRTIEMQRELDVDDLVIRSIQDPLPYATALLSVQKIAGHSRLTMNAATGEQQQLLLRIKRILKQPSENTPFDPKPFFLPVVAGMLLWIMLSVTPLRISLAETSALSRADRVIPFTGQEKRAPSTDPNKIVNNILHLLAGTEIQKRAEAKAIRRSPAKISETRAEDKFIRVNTNDAVTINSLSVKKEDRSFTYQDKAKSNSGSPFTLQGEPFIPSNSFEKGKEGLPRSANKSDINVNALRERMDQVRLLASLWEKMQQATGREEKIQLTLLWRKEMEKRKHNTPARIKKIVVL